MKMVDQRRPTMSEVDVAESIPMSRHHCAECHIVTLAPLGADTANCQHCGRGLMEDVVLDLLGLAVRVHEEARRKAEYERADAEVTHLLATAQLAFAVERLTQRREGRA